MADFQFLPSGVMDHMVNESLDLLESRGEVIRPSTDRVASEIKKLKEMLIRIRADLDAEAMEKLFNDPELLADSEESLIAKKDCEMSFKSYEYKRLVEPLSIADYYSSSRSTSQDFTIEPISIAEDYSSSRSISQDFTSNYLKEDLLSAFYGNQVVPIELCSGKSYWNKIVSALDQCPEIVNSQKTYGEMRKPFEYRLIGKWYALARSTSKDSTIRKRKDLYKELLSAVYGNQVGPTELCSGESELSFRRSLKELEEVVNNFKEAKRVDTLQPPQVSSRPSDRNRKKRLKKKLKKKAKREEMDSNLLRSNCLLYMFASMYSGGYLLYRIDALEHARKSDKNNELLPLLVFGTGVLPVGFCTLVQMKDYLYFVGENPCDVFKIRKIDLKNLSPGEDNLGLEYLIPIKQQMQGPKRSPLVFVVNENLFVISRDYSCISHEFEMYSPTNSLWKDLNSKPKGHGSLKSHVVLDNIAYFATTDETVLSYNLSNGIWSTVSTAPKYPRTFCDIHPAFDAPVEIVGDMILGAFKLPSDFNITVAASPHPRCDDSVKDSFMRPTLAPDSKFWPEFARRFDYIRNDESHGSHYMTALQTLDGQNILCFVSYGSNPSTDEPHRSYALLTFYKILGDNWKTSVRLKEEVLEGADKFCYYSRQVEAGNAVKSYFSLDFLNRKLFDISTTKLCTIGKLITCLAY